MRRAAFAALLIGLAGCTLLRAYGGGSSGSNSSGDDAPKDDSSAKAGAPPEPGVVVAPPEEEEDDDDEGGVKKISKAMRTFNRALQTKNFEEARAALSRAQRAVQKASDVTRSHPDFEDIEQTVISARSRLDTAIEQDRIARRNAAIDALMRKGEGTTAQANALIVDLRDRVPTEEDVARTDELLAQFADMKSEGAQYLDENRYLQHAQARDGRAQELGAVRQIARWRLDATAQINTPMNNGYETAIVAKDKADPGEQVKLFSQADSSFRQCAQTVNDLQNDPKYDESFAIKTRLGVHDFDDTKRGCLELARQAREKVDQLTWERTVVDVVASINKPMSVLRATKSADEELKAARAAADALSKCVQNLEHSERKPGYDAERNFDSVFGKLGAAGLRGACKQERDRIVRALPTTEWRTTLGSMLIRLGEAKQKASEAAAAKEAVKLVELWTTALGGYRECVERAKKSGRERGADRAFELDTALGRHDIGALEKACQTAADEAQRELNSALKRREAEDFAGTCRGDEKEVVDREGIPTRIESFNDGRLYVGRIFIYEKPLDKGQKEMRRYAFDKAGKRVDYWVDWRNQVVQVIAEVARVTTAVKKAKDAAEQVKAVEAAMPILDVCKEVLGAGMKSPGFDGKAKFDTPLGKLTVPQLVPECAKEKDRLQSGLVALSWRAKVEDSAKRIEDAQAVLDKSAKLGPDQRIDQLGAALGSLSECSERAGALVSQPGADKKLKLKTARGALTVGEIDKACAKLKGEVQAAADRALGDKKTEEFVKGCKGDEIEVVRREGVPEKIEDVGQGRVFIYTHIVKGKKMAKRFAFNPAGKRLDEKLLAADKSAKPEHVQRTSDGDTVPIPDLEKPK